MYEPAFAGRIVNAYAVLHNMRIHHRLPMPDYDEADNQIIANDHDNRHERDVLVTRSSCCSSTHTTANNEGTLSTVS